MAAPKKEKGETYKYPSRFGSHASMVDQPLTDAFHNVLLGEYPDVTKEQLAVINKLIAESDGTDLVVLRDEHKTPYTTSRKVLDNGMADLNRNASSRLEYLCITVKKE